MVIGSFFENRVSAALEILSRARDISEISLDGDVHLGLIFAECAQLSFSFGEWYLYISFLRVEDHDDIPRAKDSSRAVLGLVSFVGIPNASRTLLFIFFSDSARADNLGLADLDFFSSSKQIGRFMSPASLAFRSRSCAARSIER